MVRGYMSKVFKFPADCPAEKEEEILNEFKGDAYRIHKTFVSKLKLPDGSNITRVQFEYAPLNLDYKWNDGDDYGK